jgi:hypothetical protein
MLKPCKRSPSTKPDFVLVLIRRTWKNTVSTCDPMLGKLCPQVTLNHLYQLGQLCCLVGSVSKMTVPFLALHSWYFSHFLGFNLLPGNQILLPLCMLTVGLPRDCPAYLCPADFTFWGSWPLPSQLAGIMSLWLKWTLNAMELSISPSISHFLPTHMHTPQIHLPGSAMPHWATSGGKCQPPCTQVGD